MDRGLSFDLHALTARLDRAADRILQAESGLSFRRFMALLAVAELGTATQRALAAKLGVSEPSVSRMTGLLAAAGLLDAEADPVGGNRRQLSLTPSGRDVVEQSRVLLERRFTGLVERSGVPYGDYAQHTRRLMAALDESERETRR